MRKKNINNKKKSGETTRRRSYSLNNKMKGKDRKKQILRMAQHIFAEEKYASATTARIAAAAGVTEPTIYLYFKRKKALFISVLNDCRKILIDSMREMLQEKGDIKQRYHRVFKFHQHYATQINPDIAKVWLVASSVNDSDICAVVRSFDKEMMDLLSQDIEESAKTNKITLKYQPEIFARLAIGMVVNRAHLIMINMDYQVDLAFNGALDLIVNAIA